MAASFFVAFSLGLWIRGGFDDNDAADDPCARRSMARTTQTVEMVVQGAGGKTETMQVPLLPQQSRGMVAIATGGSPFPTKCAGPSNASGGRIRQERKYFPVRIARRQPGRGPHRPD